MSKASSPMGLKRICTSCGTRFYDLNKRPIICPSCSTEFTGDIKVKARRGRLPVESKKEEPQKASAVEIDEDEILVEDEGVEVVSLEDAEAPDEDDEDDAIKLDDEDLGDLPDFEDEELDDDLEEEALLDEDED